MKQWHKMSTWESSRSLLALCSRLPPPAIISVDTRAPWPPRNPWRTLNTHGSRRPGDAHRTCHWKETSFTRTLRRMLMFALARFSIAQCACELRCYAPGLPVIPAGPTEPGLPGNPLNPGGPVFPLRPGWPSRPGTPLGPSLPWGPVAPMYPRGPVRPRGPRTPRGPGAPAAPVAKSEVDKAKRIRERHTRLRMVMARAPG